MTQSVDHLEMMFYEEQPCRCGTLSQPMCLGPARSSFERLFVGVDVSDMIAAVFALLASLLTEGNTIQ
jgi:hypothetical protein